MRFSLFTLFSLTCVVKAAENGMNEKLRVWTLMSLDFRYCLTVGGCGESYLGNGSTNRVKFTMRQRYANGTEGDERDLTRDYWSDVTCSAEWPQFTETPSTWMNCSQPEPRWHQSDFNPQWKFVGRPVGQKFSMAEKKTIAVSAQYPIGGRPAARSGLNEVYLSNTTFVVEKGHSERHDSQVNVYCGGTEGQIGMDGQMRCAWTGILETNVTTNAVSVQEYKALGLGEAQTNPSW